MKDDGEAELLQDGTQFLSGRDSFAVEAEPEVSVRKGPSSQASHRFEACTHSQNLRRWYAFFLRVAVRGLPAKYL